MQEDGGWTWVEAEDVLRLQIYLYMYLQPGSASPDSSNFHTLCSLHCHPAVPGLAVTLTIEEKMRLWGARGHVSCLSHTVSKWPNQSAGATRRTLCLACLSDGCPPYQDLLALTPGKVEGRETLQDPPSLRRC